MFGSDSAVVIRLICISEVEIEYDQPSHRFGNINFVIVFDILQEQSFVERIYKYSHLAWSSRSTWSNQFLRLGDRISARFGKMDIFRFFLATTDIFSFHHSKGLHLTFHMIFYSLFARYWLK